MSKKMGEKLDKIIKLLEDIRASQPVVYYPPVHIPSYPDPVPAYPQPWPDPGPYVPPYPNWTYPQDGTTCIPIGTIYQC